MTSRSRNFLEESFITWSGLNSRTFVCGASASHRDLLVASPNQIVRSTEGGAKSEEISRRDTLATAEDKGGHRGARAREKDKNRNDR